MVTEKWAGQPLWRLPWVPPGVSLMAREHAERKETNGGRHRIRTCSSGLSMAALWE
jgi:hypothetical protein